MLTGYAEGKCYADGKTKLRRGATPRAALGVYYADGKTWLRRGQLAVGVSFHSCSVPSSSTSDAAHHNDSSSPPSAACLFFPPHPSSDAPLAAHHHAPRLPLLQRPLSRPHHPLPLRSG
jgi:hypothetical protein